MNRIYHEIASLVNDHPSIDISFAGLLGWINFQVLGSDMAAVGKGVILTLTIILIALRIVYMVKEDRRKSKEMRLKEMEREQETWEFKKRNGLS